MKGQMMMPVPQDIGQALALILQRLDSIEARVSQAAAVKTVMNLREAAEYTRKHRSTILDAVRKGEIPYNARGRCYTFRVEDLDRWNNQNTANNAVNEFRRAARAQAGKTAKGAN